MATKPKTTMSNNEPLSEQCRIGGEEWAVLDAAATLLEDTKSAFLSQRMQFYLEQGFAVNKAEQAVKASDEWTEYIQKTVAARKAANLAKVQYEYLKMRYHEEQSYNATRRAEMRLGAD